MVVCILRIFVDEFFGNYVVLKNICETVDKEDSNDASGAHWKFYVCSRFLLGFTYHSDLLYSIIIFITNKIQN